MLSIHQAVIVQNRRDRYEEGGRGAKRRAICFIGVEFRDTAGRTLFRISFLPSWCRTVKLDRRCGERLSQEGMACVMTMSEICKRSAESANFCQAGKDGSVAEHGAKRDQVPAIRNFLQSG